MTVEAVVGYAFEGIFMGIIIGTMSAWNEKVFHFFWLLAAVLGLVGTITAGPEQYATEIGLLRIIVY